MVTAENQNLPTIQTVAVVDINSPELKPTQKRRVSFGLKQTYQFRSDLSIMGWRQAVMAARNPERHDRTLLYRIYKEALIDSHLRGLLRTRCIMAQGAPFVLIQDGKVNPDITQVLNRPWYRQMIYHIIEARFWGHSLVELGFQDFYNEKLKFNEFSSINFISRELVRPEYEDLEVVQFTEKRIPYTQPPFNKYILPFGEKYDLGELENIIPETALKRYSITDWSRRSEKFGMPTIVWKTDETDKNTLDEKARAAANLGSDGFIMPTLDDVVETLKTESGTDPHSIYRDKADWHDRQMSKALVGGTMISDNGSSRSQAEVHERIFKEFSEADLRYCEDEMNFKVIPKLIEFGYPLKGYTFKFNQFLKEYLNPGASALEEANAQTPTAPGKQTGKQPAQRGTTANFTQPVASIATGIEPIIAHIQFMRNIATPTAAEKDPIAPLYKSLTGVYNKHLQEFYEELPNVPEDSTLLQHAAETGIERSIITRFLKSLASKIGSFLGTEFENTYKAQGSNFFNLNDEFIITEAKKSLFNFSYAKSLSELETLRDAVFDGDAVRPYTQFRKIALAINKEWNENWLRTEHDQVLQSGIMASKWQDIERQKELYPLLQYNAIIDTNTTRLCNSLNGIVKPVDDVFWDNYYPPNHWNCRAGVTQIRSGEKPETPPAETQTILENTRIEPYFAINVGKTGRTFSDLHPYFKATEADKQALNTLANG